jgi:hypothetical protein
MSVITDENGQKSFDLRTHIRDPKTGFITKKQPYSLSISKEKGEIFTREGKRYYRDGSPVKDGAPPSPPSGAIQTDPRAGKAA